MRFLKRILAHFIFVGCFALYSFSNVFAQEPNIWNIYVPGPFAPLSPFVMKSDTIQEELQLTIKPELFQYLVNNNLGGFIAFKAEGSEVVSYLAATSADYNTGIVSVSTNQPGNYVFVSDAFKNDFPIVTHWNQALNNGRGGQQFGASDELGYFDVDLNQNSYITELHILDTNPQSPYTYDTGQYALFSGDPVNPNTPVPGFENYIGEKYAIYKIRDKLAIFLSNLTIIKTGFPLLHRNFPYAFDESTTDVQKRIRSNIPAYQVAHALEVAFEPDKSSLATVILPPYWSSTPTTKYPVLMNSFYDINENFAAVNGWSYISIMSDLENLGDFVGILWNGGGAKGTRSLNRSFYDNASLLFDLAEIHLGADKNRVVTTGISRGGLTALQLAANPYYSNYTVKYAISVAPAVKYGDHIYNFFGNTYPGLYELVGNDEGYKYSWQEGWVDPITGLPGGQLVLYNLMGTTDQQLANDLAPISDLHIQSLLSKGTNIKLIYGTNDGFMPISLGMEYYNKLQANNVPSELNLVYRGGHNWSLDKEVVIKELMGNVLSETYQTINGLRQYKRVDNNIAENIVEFIPALQPFVLEAPEIVVSGEIAQIDILGGAGGFYQLLATKIDEDQLVQGNFISEYSRIIDTGSFDPAGPELQTNTVQWEISFYDASSDTGFEEGLYLYSLYYTYDGQNVYATPYDSIPKSESYFEIPQAPGYKFQHAYFLIEANEPTEKSAAEMVGELMNNGRGWGMSSDQVH